MRRYWSIWMWNIKTKFVKCKGRESSLTTLFTIHHMKVHLRAFVETPCLLGEVGQRASHSMPHMSLLYTERRCYTTGRAGIRLIYIINCMTAFISPPFEVFFFLFLSIAWPRFYFCFNSWIVVGMSWFKNIGSFLGWICFYWSLLVYLGYMLGIDDSLD